MVKILIINSKLDLKKFLKKRGVEASVDYKTLNIKPEMVKIGTLTRPDGTVVPAYSPYVVEDVRGIIEPLHYNFVLFCYQADDFPNQQTTGGKAYAYPNVYIGTHLATIRLDGSEENYATHEITHLIGYHLSKLGFPVHDQMDVTLVNGKYEYYYKNFQPDALNGNYARTWATFAPYIRYIDEFPPLMKKGSKNRWVSDLQLALYELGYWTLSTDGDFGSNTERCVKNFQEKKGLVPDGIVGAKTLSALVKKKY